MEDCQHVPLNIFSHICLDVYKFEELQKIKANSHRNSEKCDNFFDLSNLRVFNRITYALSAVSYRNKTQ